MHDDHAVQTSRFEGAVEDALAGVRGLFRLIVEKTSELVVVHRGGKILYANPTLIACLGYENAESLYGRPLGEILHAEDVTRENRRVRVMLATNEAAPLYTYRLVRRDGCILTVEVASAPAHFEGGTAVISLCRDITTRIETEARVYQANLMNSMGTLAAGVAHEINNPLAYVTLNIALVTKKLEDLASASGARGDVETQSLARELLGFCGEALDGTERVAQIVRDFRVFSSANQEERRPIDVRRVLDASIKVADNEIRHRAHLVRNYGDVPLVHANEARLGQVFLNLLVNALQALPQGSAQTNEIRVVTATHKVSGSALIEIRDNGPGIPPEIMNRVFEPFFTTKPVGVGSGLGLSICRSIVSAHGGRIEIESEVGKGTVVRVTLLPAESVDLGGEPRSEIPKLAPVVPRLSVLVVDDEPALLSAIVRQLERNHDVDGRTSWKGALEALADKRYDAVLCDVMMPGVSGFDIHRSLCERMPESNERIVYMTGGAFTQEARSFLAQAPNRCLEKPFSPADLEEILRAIAPRARASSSV
ncbi:ATP-binding protein [Polyangium sp. 6x1]|uniref:hybrid sensor histidine kinase/response regulator n=1 Tax=Polyangium sp. 6x1 TaxID=3042689 RepID=UPI0024830C18|nr:ATP-binding protein [Polyangium sp. 6x1]MDI1446259.1 ATP-binding protein [Polyangium sp. 6x1]